jgi:hypothetical protein
MQLEFIEAFRILGFRMVFGFGSAIWERVVLVCFLGIGVRADLEYKWNMSGGHLMK